MFITKDYRLIVALYVDDLLILGKDIEEVNRFKRELSSRFDVKDLGEVSLILGIRITRNRATRSITLDQKHYIRDMLKEFSISPTDKGVATPMLGYDSLSPTDPKKIEPPTDARKFQSFTGKMN